VSKSEFLDHYFTLHEDKLIEILSSEYDRNTQSANIFKLLNKSDPKQKLECNGKYYCQSEMSLVSVCSKSAG